MAQGPFAHLFSGVYEQVHGSYKSFIVQVQAETGSFWTNETHIFSLTLKSIPLVAHVAEYALCLGDYKTAPHCPYNDPENPAESSTLEMFSFFHFMTFLTLSSI